MECVEGNEPEKEEEEEPEGFKCKNNHLLQPSMNSGKGWSCDGCKKSAKSLGKIRYRC